MTTAKERSNAIRALAMDAVEQANSGHPGAPMGLADVAQVLWLENLKYNPRNPKWFDRDRFVLSNGHASMLLYAVLHLTGYDVSINDIKRFRQLHSKTAGHPEYGECPGVETTTGPLGQGLANAVGMALAEALLAKQFNQPGFEIVNHRTWVIVGDGCLMEGISHEAASLAGTLKLGKLTAIYDDNGISIDGETKYWFTEDVSARFRAYGWEVISDVDGHDIAAIRNALQSARQSSNQPTLIACKTTIGYGAPTKGGTASTHGSPLGAEEVDAARKCLDWEWEPFEVPKEIRSSWDRQAAGKANELDWKTLFEEYAEKYAELAEEFLRRMNGILPRGLESAFDEFIQETQANIQSLETRKASGACLNFLGPRLEELIGGSADLTGSNNTQWDGAGWLWEDGRYLNFGVREFGMTAIANGMALHGGFIPYTGTFLVFMEYARNAVRLAALMGLRQILVYTHDSVGLGEDGPTHQPVEQLTNLRTTPNMSVWRPCDSVETAVAWKHALYRAHGPTAIVLTRQKTQPQARSDKLVELVARGGYVLHSECSSLEVVVIATGSEVELAVEAVARLGELANGVRIVSMPSVDTFLEQDTEYRQSVLPPQVRQRVSVEAGHTDYWSKFVGLDGVTVGINRFGVSAPGHVAMDALGMNVESVIDAIRSVMD
ncbi:MAG: transketolase [Gammaproteobacteria bacterium]|nr:transketolase [Gammaproteobacteria bacterium]MYD80438.1 transketolase [Gammaproteobacteria bacterium]